MPRPFPAEFQRKAIALVRAGKPITTAAVELGFSAAAIHNGVRQDQIDRGERPGITTPERMKLAKAKKRIRQTRNGGRNSEGHGADTRGRSPGPTRIHPVVDVLGAPSPSSPVLFLKVLNTVGGPNDSVDIARGMFERTTCRSARFSLRCQAGGGAGACRRSDSVR